MQIINYPHIDHFITSHPNSKSSLISWHKLITQHTFTNFNELKSVFPSADVVKNNKGKSLTVFNINGNHARLIVEIRYNRHTVIIHNILTHSEYDKNKWK